MSLTLQYRTYLSQSKFNFYSTDGSKFLIDDNALEGFYDNIMKSKEPTNLHEYNKGAKGIWADMDMISDVSTPIMYKIYDELATQLIQSVRANMTSPIDEGDLYILSKAPRPDGGKTKHSLHLRIPTVRVKTTHLKDILIDFEANVREQVEAILGKIPSFVDLKIVGNSPLAYGCVKNPQSQPHLLDVCYKFRGAELIRRSHPKECIGRLVSIYNNPEGIYYDEEAYDEEIYDLEYLLGSYPAEFTLMYRILENLPEEFTRETRKWKAIMRYLARSCETKEMYTSLATYFSKRCPEAFDDKTLGIIEQIYTSTTGNRLASNFGPVINMLRENNREKYNELISLSLNQNLYHIITMGDVNVLSVADIITPFLTRYKCDRHAWYEYVSPTDFAKNPRFYLKTAMSKYAISDGQGMPESMRDTLMSMYRVHSELVANLQRKAEAMVEEGEGDVTAYKKVVSLVKKAGTKLSFSVNSPAMISTLRNKLFEANLKELLDQNQNMMGVMNGVLVLGKNIELLTLCETYYISRSARANYKPYNPECPYIIRMEKVIAQILRNDDLLYDFIMKILASSLDGYLHDICVLLHSQGNSGKSTLMHLICDTLGPANDSGYSCKVPAGFLNAADSGDSPSASLGSLGSARITFANEINPSLPLNTIKIKELWDRPGGRGLYELKTSEYRTSGALLAYCNLPLAISISDPGFWRRFVYIFIKTTFNTDIKEDTSIRELCNGVSEESQNYRDAMLSILGKNYALYYRDVLEKGLNLRNAVPHRFQLSTYEFRSERDPVLKFITRKLKKSPGLSVTKEAVYDSFCTWCSDPLRRIRDPEVLKAALFETIPGCTGDGLSIVDYTLSS